MGVLEGIHELIRLRDRPACTNRTDISMDQAHPQETQSTQSTGARERSFGPVVEETLRLFISGKGASMWWDGLRRTSLDESVHLKEDGGFLGE